MNYTRRTLVFLRPAAAILCSAVFVVPAAHAARARLPYFLAQLTPTATTPADTSTALRPVEQKFIVQGVETGRTVAELSRLAVSQASASSVRDLAEQLVSDYSTINGSLEALARRKAVAVPVQPTSNSDASRQLAAKDASNFDRSFVRLLNAASQHELQLCEATVANARDADVRELAGSMLPVLRDHVNKTIALEKSF